VVPGLSNSNRPDFFHPTVYPYRDEELIADHEDRGSAIAYDGFLAANAWAVFGRARLGDSGIRLGSRSIWAWRTFQTCKKITENGRNSRKNDKMKSESRRIFQIFSIDLKKPQDGENRGLWRLANDKGRYLWGPSVWHLQQCFFLKKNSKNQEKS
jgi:hypothetical protein